MVFYCPACGKMLSYEETKYGGCYGCGVDFVEYWADKKEKAYQEQSN